MVPEMLSAANKNAASDAMWDAARKLGADRNQYNPFSASWKNYENAYAFQEKINGSLNSAIQNGYELDDWAAEDIALDLAEYDSEFENDDPKQLIPYIQAWKSGRAYLKTL